MSRITFIDNKRQRWFIKRRVLRIEKAIRIYNAKFDSFK